LSHAKAGSKIVLYFLGVLIVSVMITWFGILSWGVIATLQWLLDCIKNFWTTYF